MSSFVWPSDDGWPYPDSEREMVDLDDEFDDDILSLRIEPAHVFATLDPLERTVIEARYGLNGRPGCSLKELQAELGVPRADLRLALGSGLSKLRAQFS